MMLMTPGWHFVEIRDGRPVLRDGSPLVVGRTYEHVGKLVVCPGPNDLRRGAGGYHDSVCVIDALRYAPGPGICRTLASGDLSQDDKRCSRYRVAVAYYDATRELHELSVYAAYAALLGERERGREPDPRSWAAVAAKRRWLDGAADNQELAATRSAAWSAEWSAPAWSAAEFAARSAESAGSAGPAESAAGSAVWSAGPAAREHFKTVLLGLLPSALVRSV